MKPILLASTSPRRKELLEKIGLKFQIVSSDYEEDMKQGIKQKPDELAITLSAGKAKVVALRYANHIVIAADTFVVLENELLGKPHTGAEAAKMLKKISGKEITVVTGFTIMETPENKIISEAVETKVYIKDLTDDEIAAYVKTGEPLDKAGAFAVQGIGALIVKKIDGDFFNVVGLPLFQLAERLKDFGIYALS
jgi:septum formation protein